MSEVDYTLDEYVQGTPDRQARYIYDFRLKLANLSTVVGSELAGRVEILDKVVTHSSTAHERILRAGHARIHIKACAEEFRRFLNLSDDSSDAYDFSVIDWDRYVLHLGERQTHEVHLTRAFDLHAQAGTLTGVLASDILDHIRALMAAQHRRVKSEASTAYAPCVTMSLVDEAHTKDLRLRSDAQKALCDSRTDTLRAIMSVCTTALLHKVVQHLGGPVDDTIYSALAQFPLLRFEML